MHFLAAAPQHLLKTEPLAASILYFSPQEGSLAWIATKGTMPRYVTHVYCVN